MGLPASRNGVAGRIGVSEARLRKIEGRGLPACGETAPPDYEVTMSLVVALRKAGWSVQRIRLALAAASRVNVDEARKEWSALAQGDEEVSELRAMNADKAKTIGELSSTIFKRERTFTPAEREALEYLRYILTTQDVCIRNPNFYKYERVMEAMLAERSANE